jgi:hypothetical protein
MSALLKPSAHESQHLALARGQRGEHRIGGRLPGLQERQHRVAESLPCRLVLEQDVIARVELDELSARDSAGEPAPFRNRTHRIVARMQHERRRGEP